MDKKIDNPWFLRSVALIFAIILFIAVRAGEENKNGGAVGDTSGIIGDIPVTVFYDNENLVVTGVPDTVNVIIEGPANLVQTTKLLKDFSLRVDLRSLPLGEHKVSIQHENISEKLKVSLDPATVDVVIEEKITQSFRVDPELNERLLAEDFILQKMEVTPTTIEVTGAKSVIDAISFVKASVSAEQGLNKSFEQQARVRVLDKDLNKLNVTIVPEQVNVKVDIAEYSKEMPVVLRTIGLPETGVTVDKVSTAEKAITLSGSRKILDEMKEFIVDVEVSSIKGNETLEVDLKKPKGVSKMSLERLKVNVNATVVESDDQASAVVEEPVESEKTATKKFDNIPVTVKGLDGKYKSTFLQPTNGFVGLTAIAESKRMETLNNKDFTVYVDASSITTEGEQTLPFTVEGPNGVRWTLSPGVATMQIELA